MGPTLLRQARRLFRTAFALCLLLGAGAHAQGIKAAPGNYQSGLSGIVPTTATTVIPAMPGVNATRTRIVAIDTAIQSGGTSTVTIWCAWGLASANPAAIGTNGFPLNAGFDDSGFGVNQLPLNCIQAAGQTHYARLEQY